MNVFAQASRGALATPYWVLLCWGMAGVALGLGILLTCHGSVCAAPLLDRQLLEALHAWRHPWLDGLMGTVTWFGSIIVLLPVALILGWRYWRDDKRAAAMLLPLSIVGAGLIAHVTKLLVARPRPDLFQPLVDMPADPSFPSAHTMQVTALALAWILVLGLRRNPAIIAAVVLLVALVALSRLYLQVHFPSDVLAGVVAGAAWVAGLRLLFSVRS